MCGQTGNYGTGSFQVILDMKEMEKLDAFDVNMDDEASIIDSKLSKQAGLGCSKTDIAIQNNIANISKGVPDEICDDGFNVGF